MPITYRPRPYDETSSSSSIIQYLLFDVGYKQERKGEFFL